MQGRYFFDPDEFCCGVSQIAGSMSGLQYAGYRTDDISIEDYKIAKRLFDIYHTPKMFNSSNAGVGVYMGAFCSRLL